MTIQVKIGKKNKVSISVLEILDKHGIKGLSIQEKHLSPNNLSRSKFARFCQRNGFTRLNASNSFELAGKYYGYSLIKNGKVECRQFGEHYSGLVCESETGEVSWYDKSQLHIGNITRIGPDGVKYFNATLRVKI